MWANDAARPSESLDLIARAQRGDTDAVGALYDLHHESIFRYVSLRVGDWRLAEDLTGDVFMRMIASLPAYRSVGLPFRAWLYRIAHNLLVDHFRKQHLHVVVPLDAAEETRDDSDPTSEVDHRLNAARLRHALSQLDPNQREVVVLRFVSGLSLQETALATGRSEAAIKSLQHRGLAALRRDLQPEREQVVAR